MAIGRVGDRSRLSLRWRVAAVSSGPDTMASVGTEVSGSAQQGCCVFCLVGCHYHQAMSRPVEVLVTFVRTLLKRWTHFL